MDAELITRLLDGVRHYPGDVAEIGVYKGESAVHIAHHIAGTAATVHLYDTFCGMHKCDISSCDGHMAGDFADTSVDLVRKRLVGYKYQIHEGRFPLTAHNCPLKFVHIDVDLLEITTVAYEFAWRNLVPGGIVLNDDYGFSKCKGAAVATHKFSEKYGVPVYFSGRRVWAVKDG